MHICDLFLKLMQMSGISRIVPRLTSMAFKLKFQDLVNEIIPVSKTFCTLLHSDTLPFVCLYLLTLWVFTSLQLLVSHSLWQ